MTPPSFQVPLICHKQYVQIKRNRAIALSNLDQTYFSILFSCFREVCEPEVDTIKT